MGFRREHKTTQNKIQKNENLIHRESTDQLVKRGGCMAKLILKYFSVLAIPMEEETFENCVRHHHIVGYSNNSEAKHRICCSYFAFTADWDWGILLLKFLYQTLLFDGSKALLFSEPLLEWHSISSRAYFSSWRLTIRLSRARIEKFVRPRQMFVAVIACHPSTSTW